MRVHACDPGIAHCKLTPYWYEELAGSRSSPILVGQWRGAVAIRLLEGRICSPWPAAKTDTQHLARCNNSETPSPSKSDIPSQWAAGLSRRKGYRSAAEVCAFELGKKAGSCPVLRPPPFPSLLSSLSGRASGPFDEDRALRRSVLRFGIPLFAIYVDEHRIFPRPKPRCFCGVGVPVPMLLNSSAAGPSDAGGGECAGRACTIYKSSGFGHYYLQDVKSIASSHTSEDQDVAFWEVRAHATLLHRHAEDGKLEGLGQQILQFEKQVGEIKELLKWCKEEREKTGQAKGNAQRAAPPLEPRRSSLRLKKPRKSWGDGLIQSRWITSSTTTCKVVILSR